MKSTLLKKDDEELPGESNKSRNAKDLKSSLDEGDEEEGDGNVVIEDDDVEAVNKPAISVQKFARYSNNEA